MRIGMIDAQCPKCKHRYGWTGELVHKPPCPRCGHQVPRAQLEADQRRLERSMQLLELPGAASLGTCQHAACGAELLFVRTAKSGGTKVMPVSPEPHKMGNVRLTEDGCQVLSGAQLEQARAAGEPLHLSHFAACPGAAGFRRSKEAP